MAGFKGQINKYGLSVQTPNVFTNYKRVIDVNGKFGLGFLYFVPAGGKLGQNKKRDGKDVFDVYFWMEDYAALTDMLRNEKPVYFFYNTDNNTCVIKTGDEKVGEMEK